MAEKVENTDANLRDLLTSVYVAVISYIPTQEHHLPAARHVSEEAWDALATTVLDAAEGRPFTPLELPWPPNG